MANWLQNTHVIEKDGTTKDSEPILRDADRMLELIAQVSFIRQAVGEIELHLEHDNNFNVTRYIVHRRRCLDGREIIMTFDRM